MTIRLTDSPIASPAWTDQAGDPSAAASPAASLFGGTAGTTVIRVDAQSGQRGLTAAEHAERVLALLLGRGRG